MIFILGNHRSGTTILYNALVASGAFCHPGPYHLAHFAAWRAPGFDPRAALAETERRFREAGVVDRVVDRVPAHTRSPEEYGFVLRGGRIGPATLDTFRAFCEFVRSDASPDRALLLKNPRDFTRFLFIHRAFPEARFVFIHRHPGPTIDSRIRELRLLFARPSPYQVQIEPWYAAVMRGRVRRRLIRACLGPTALVELTFLLGFRSSSARYLRDLPLLPAERYRATTYERLCEAPGQVVEELLAFLEVGPRDGAAACAMIRPRPQAEDRAGLLRSDFARRLLGPYLEHCGYADLWPSVP